MLTLSNRSQLIIALALVIFLVATRSHHFATWHNLPGASWAVFFLAGVYLKPKWWLAVLFSITWIIDFSAYQWGGGSNFCFSPAYIFLLPAYSALWFAGHWFSHQYQFKWNTLILLIASVFIGAFACELFSSGGFYFYSGHFADTNLIEFGNRIIKYFPSYLQSLYFYVGIAAIIHLLFSFASETKHSTKQIQ